MKNQKFGFIGIGNMASAIIAGILKSGKFAPEQICMYNPHPEKTERFVQSGCIAYPSASALAKDCGIIFLCVKPQVFPVVLDEIKPVIQDSPSGDILFVSIAAGITFKNLQDALGDARPYVRAMPNTPLLLGEGATALSRTPNVSDEVFSLIFDIFSCCGIAREIPEEQIDAIISVSGSSPAYLYMLAQITCAYAEQHGIDPKTALDLFCQTMKGSADMLVNSGKDPQSLIDMVTSKGGTTFRLLGVLKDRDINGIMMDAFAACEKRAKELSM